MTASCACGQALITVNAPPSALGVCHCSNCKWRTGSAFGISAYFDRSAVVRQEGENERLLVSSQGAEPRPAAALLLQMWNDALLVRLDSADKIGIAGGCFAEQGLGEPTYSVSDGKREPWIALPSEWQVCPG